MNNGAEDMLRKLAFEKVLLYLKFMRKKVTKIDKAKLNIIVSERVPYMPDEWIKIGIIFIGSWVRIFTILYEDFDVSMFGEDAVEILRGMLRLQDDHMEFTFSLSKNNTLVVKEDIHAKALTYDVFREEYDAILEAYKKFQKNIVPLIKRAKKVNAEKFVEVW